MSLDVPSKFNWNRSRRYDKMKETSAWLSFEIWKTSSIISTLRCVTLYIHVVQTKSTQKLSWWKSCDSSHVKTKPATAGAGKMIRFGSEVQKATIKEKTQYFKKDNWTERQTIFYFKEKMGKSFFFIIYKFLISSFSAFWLLTCNGSSHPSIDKSWADSYPSC